MQIYSENVCYILLLWTNIIGQMTFFIMYTGWQRVLTRFPDIFSLIQNVWIFFPLSGICGHFFFNCPEIQDNFLVVGISKNLFLLSGISGRFFPLWNFWTFFPLPRISRPFTRVRNFRTIF